MHNNQISVIISLAKKSREYCFNIVRELFRGYYPSETPAHDASQPLGRVVPIFRRLDTVHPNIFYYPRRQYDICKFVGGEKLMHLVVLSKSDKDVNSTKLTMPVMKFSIVVVSRDWSRVKTFTENRIRSSSTKCGYCVQIKENSYKDTTKISFN